MLDGGFSQAGSAPEAARQGAITRGKRSSAATVSFIVDGAPISSLSARR